VAESTYAAPGVVLAVAHRGGAGLGVENTLDAFERSFALGVRHLETDVRVISDGTCVAFHDTTLDRVVGRPGRVRDLSERERRAHGIPTLAEVLRAFPDARFALDVKEAAAVGPLARLLRQTGSAHRVCAAGAWDGWLTRLRRQTGPELTTAMGWRASASGSPSGPSTSRRRCIACSTAAWTASSPTVPTCCARS
jgi:glycerophosphoryl diester phosphodiesterase